jgi:DNA-binding transcriptional ArsR family regulator
MSEINGADWFSLSRQLTSVSRLTGEKKPTLNRRMPGVPRDYGSSLAVLKYLRETGGYRMACEIKSQTNRSRAAVSYALIFLRRVGLIEAVPDVVRNSRYLRYRSKQ